MELERLTRSLRGASMHYDMRRSTSRVVCSRKGYQFGRLACTGTSVAVRCGASSGREEEGSLLHHDGGRRETGAERAGKAIDQVQSAVSASMTGRARWAR